MPLKRNAPPRPQRNSKYTALRKIVSSLKPGGFHIVDVSDEEYPEKAIKSARSSLNYGEPSVIEAQWDKGIQIRTYVCAEGNLVVTAEKA